MAGHGGAAEVRVKLDLEWESLDREVERQLGAVARRGVGPARVAGPSRTATRREWPLKLTVAGLCLWVWFQLSSFSFLLLHLVCRLNTLLWVPRCAPVSDNRVVEGGGARPADLRPPAKLHQPMSLGQSAWLYLERGSVG